MNTKNLKAYAPKARSQFIEAIKKRAAQFGIYEGENGKTRIEDVKIEGSVAIIEGRAFTRQEGEQRKRLDKKVAERGYDMFIREMAYTWFNRLAAIRYMELHGYFDHGLRVLSHPSGNDSLPEILSHASDVADGLKLDKSHIIELQLAGDKEEQLYRELLLGQCHQLANIMPFVFKGLTADSIDDAAELLLPDNLTKTDSILKGLIADIPEEDWEDIEVIGWLYQFYISEHKDSVMGKVIKSEDIPAATQLFTPNWIVKYLVQNSLGRQWLATYPDSELKGKMEYYIEPAEQSDEVIEQLKAITPTSIDPEEIKVLDPAAGSGHILVEVYEVLRGIYLERGYRLREIPELILTKNIYGLDIDDRAAQLAGFALMMKAREDDRRIFQRVEEGEVSLNVYSLQSTEHLDIPKLWKALDLEGNQQTGTTGGLFETTEEFDQPTGIYKEYFELLQYLKSSFLQAKTLGSLIHIKHKNLATLLSLKELLEAKFRSSDPAASAASAVLLPIAIQALILAQRYDAVIANPPYMGSKGMNSDLKAFAKKEFPDSKSDLFAVFIERGFKWLKYAGFNSMVTMQSWMFLSSYENMRDSMLRNFTIENMLHMGNGVMKIAFGTNATVFRKMESTGYKGRFSYCENSDINDAGMPFEFPVQSERLTTAATDDFKKIPGSPIAYWFKENSFNVFEDNSIISDLASVRTGMTTADNNRFLRGWFEVEHPKVNFSAVCSDDALISEAKWFPYNKGGGYRKWYGMNDSVINWEDNGRAIKENKDDKGKLKASIRSEEYYFQKSITYSSVTSSKFSSRYCGSGFLFDSGGSSIFSESEDNLYLLQALLSTSLPAHFLSAFNSTINFQPGDVSRIPVPTLCKDLKEKLLEKVIACINISKSDWNSTEISWDFEENELMKLSSNCFIKDAIKEKLDLDSKVVEDLATKEKSIEQLLVTALNLDSEIESNQTLKDITINRNPEFLFRTIDTSSSAANLIINKEILELISYSFGCMMGRYSLNVKGLVYANSSNKGFKELESEGIYKTFPADDDGIIPLASEDWLFDDDATTRFKEFVKAVWGDEHLSKNLEFVAESLCLHALKPVKGESANDTVRRYFSKQFYKDHCKTYKKRPIYWLFSSGKEKAFECLVYLHRYNESTLSRMRTEYVTPLMGKFGAQHTLMSEQQIQATGTEARRIEKELKTLDKKQAELRTFDEQLKHYAEKRITLDLDDGVKANYGNFGNLLADVKAIHGKAVK